MPKIPLTQNRAKRDHKAANRRTEVPVKAPFFSLTGSSHTISPYYQTNLMVIYHEPINNIKFIPLVCTTCYS